MLCYVVVSSQRKPSQATFGCCGFALKFEDESGITQSAGDNGYFGSGGQMFILCIVRHSTLIPSNVQPQSLLLHLVRRRSAARRLQAVRIRQGHPAVHRAAPAGLRAGSHQARRAGRTGQAREGRAESRAVPAAEVRPAFLQHVAARHEEADGRPGPHRRKPARLHAGVLARRARHLRELRVPHPDRPAGQVRAALPGHREVRQHRPAPRGRQQRPDGRGVRGTDPQVRRTLQRDRRGALHPARSHPADGQSAVHRGRRRR